MRILDLSEKEISEMEKYEKLLSARKVYEDLQDEILKEKIIELCELYLAYKYLNKDSSEESFEDFLEDFLLDLRSRN